MLKKAILPILIMTIWISISEFVRNEFLLKAHWIKHFEVKGLVFPADPINGAVWGVWSLCFAIIIYVLLKRFNPIQAITIAWFIGFPLMWLVIGNLGVLPYSILPVAVPLSLLEVSLAVFIANYFKRST